jgi:nicotinate-nucleotide adenylyltransferase
MGSDNLQQFSHWRSWQALAHLVPIAVVQRPGTIMAALNAPLVRRFGVRRDLRADGKPPSVTVLDGARNRESATRLRALGSWGGRVPMLDSRLQPETRP